LASLLPGDEILRHIWLTIRLPRVLLALLVGAALALSGCVMQGLFRNPRRSGPVGISGAALAVACWLVLPCRCRARGAVCPMLAAFIGSMAVMVVIFILSRAGDASLSRLLLVGIAINALCGALVGVLAWISNDTQLRQLSLWGMGSLGQAEWSTLLVAATLMIPASLVVWRWLHGSTCCSWAMKKRTTSASTFAPCSVYCCCAAHCWWRRRWLSAALSALSAWWCRT
jgi:iron complex transport system permease protein